ncbi:MAG: MFS transporter [Candidatus Bathyarchaeota archaeon]|nr:MFS transporter [Candidatus Bathyarchaeota archaeon]
MQRGWEGVTSDSNARDGGNGRAVRLLSFGLLVSVLMHALVHAAGNMRSILFPVLEEEFSLTYQQIGLIAAIPLLCQVLISIPAGLFSDRFGARRLIALSILMAAVGAFLGGISLNPWMYIAATTLTTLNSTIYHPAAQSYTTKITKPEDRARALGIWNGGGTFGMSLGPLSISVLMGVFAFQWRQVYQFWVLPILFGLAVLFFMKDPTEVMVGEASLEKGEADSASSLLSSNMIMFLASSGVRTFGGSLTSGFLSIWLAKAQGWSLADMGLMFGASSMMGIVVSPLGGEMASRFGEKRWAVVTLFASYTCFVLAITLKGFWPFMIFYLAQRFFGILEMPAGAAITARLSPPRQRGMGFALSALPGSLVGAAAPIVAAFIADSYGIYPIFIAAAVIYYVGLGVLQFGVKID